MGEGMITEGRKFFDFNLMMIKSLGSVPDGWEIFKWEVLNHDTAHECIQFVGGVGRKITRGKRKGRTTWRGMDQSKKMIFAFTHDQIREYKRKWEAETGMCSSCHGNGTRAIGWSAVDGTRYRPCENCDASGLIPAIIAKDQPQ